MESTSKQSVATRFLRFGLIAAAVTVLSAGALVTGARDTEASVMAGNHCDVARWWVDHVGSEACLNQRQTTHYSTQVQPAAFDFARDGRSAMNQWKVTQLVGGQWQPPVSGAAGTVINSGGYGTTNVGAWRTIARSPNATHVRVTITSCSYEGSTGTIMTCASRNWSYPW